MKLDGLRVGYRLRLQLTRVIVLVLSLAVAKVLPARLIDDFSTTNSAYVGPLALHSQSVSSTLCVEILPGRGELAAEPRVPLGSEARFALLRSDAPLEIGKVLRLKLRFDGVPPGAPGDNTIGAGLVLRRDLLSDTGSMFFTVANDGRLLWSAGQSQDHPISWQFDQAMELYVKRTSQVGYRLGYRTEKGPFVPVGEQISIGWIAPETGAVIGLLVHCDERAGRAEGRILFDELAYVDDPGFPPLPDEMTGIPPRHGYPGDPIYFNGLLAAAGMAQVRWDFGEPAGPGDRSDEPIGLHVYDTPGTRTVMLTVRDSKGKSRVYRTRAIIRPAPQDAISMTLRGYLVPGDNDRAAFNDLARWEAIFAWMEEHGLNTAVSIQEHPFAYFTRVPGFPEANSDLTDGELAELRKNFEAILASARGHGVKLFFLVYNIVVPQAFANSHDLPDRGNPFDDNGLDRPLVRDYTRAAVSEFLEAFPDFGGLVLTVGEMPAHCVDFVREALIEPMMEANPPRMLILRDQTIYPDDIRVLTAGIDPSDWCVMSKMTEEQFLPGVGCRPRLFSQALGVENFYLLSRSSDLCYFGAPSLSREICLQMAREHAKGCLVASDPDIEWMLRESFARYMRDPNRPQAAEAAHWAGRLRDRYGPELPAEAMLRAGEAGSRILPLVRAQLFYRNGGYHNEFGLPLISFVGMQSVSAFEHGGITDMDKEALMTGWYPREARHAQDFLSVREFVDGNYHSRASDVFTPLRVADQLEAYAQAALAELATLRQYEGTGAPRALEYRQAVNTIEFQAWIGRFYADKLRAAVDWQCWARNLLNDGEAESRLIPSLERAQQAYFRAMRCLEAAWGANAPNRLTKIAAERYQPPWTSADQNYNGEVTSMRQLNEAWLHEIDIMRSRIRSGDRQLPYVHELLGNP